MPDTCIHNYDIILCVLYAYAILLYIAVDGFMTFGDFIELMSEVMVQTTRWGNLATKLEGYVGFDTVQEQIRKKNLKRGFEFNLMVVGE